MFQIAQAEINMLANMLIEADPSDVDKCNEIRLEIKSIQKACEWINHLIINGVQAKVQEDEIND